MMEVIYFHALKKEQIICYFKQYKSITNKNQSEKYDRFSKKFSYLRKNFNAKGIVTVVEKCSKFIKPCTCRPDHLTIILFL